MSRVPRWATSTALVAPIFVLCAPFLLSDRCLLALDVVAYYRPHGLVTRAALLHDRELPRWNPYQYAGTPLLGNSQGNHYYPPNWLFVLIGPEDGFELFVFLHLLVAAWGMYRLSRGFGLGRPASVLAALAYAAGYGAVARIHAGHPSILACHALAPILLFTLLRMLRRPSLVRAAALGVTTFLAIAGVHPQFLYHLALLSAGAVGFGIATRARLRQPWATTAAATLAAAVLGLVLAGGHVLPLLEVARETSRAQAGSLYRDREIPTHDSLLPGELALLFLPTLHEESPGSARGPDPLWHEKAIYVGVLPLMLALGAIAGPRRDGVAFFAVAGVVGLFAAMARDLPVHALFSLLPSYGGFRMPVRSAWVLSLALAALAGFGWQAATEATRPRRFMPAAVLALCVAAGWVGARGMGREAIVLAGLAMLSIAVVRLAPRHPGLWACAFLLVAADLVGFGLARLRTVPREQLAVPPWYARYIAPELRERYRLLDLTRVEAEPIAHGFRLLRGCGYPMSQRLNRFYARAWRHYGGPDEVNSLSRGDAVRSRAPLRALNVRWIVADEPPLYPGLRRVARHGAQFLYEDIKARPLAFLRGRADWTRPSMNRIDVAVSAEAPDTLLVSETWMPGWRAELDGVPVPIEPARGALLSVRVPAGVSRVRFLYDPPVRLHGVIVSALGLVALATLLIVAAFRRQRTSCR